MPTIYEIAEKAGVSPKTAARILSGETKRSKGRKAVLEWAGKLGYVRNAHAANLRTGRSQLVGLLVPYIDNPYYTHVIQEFHDALVDRDFQVIVACSFGKSEEIVAALKVFRSYNVDGIFFNGSEGKFTGEITDLLGKFEEAGKPVTLIGRNRGRLAVDQADVENAAGIAKAVSYLSGKGHRRIAFVGGRKSNRTMQARCEGFRRGLRDAGRPDCDEWVSLGEASPADAGRRATEILNPGKDDSDRPSAIVCGNDLMAMGVIKAILKSERKVPEDVSVTGFDDIEQASLFIPGLTTLRQPIDRIARDCVKQFVQRLSEKDFGKPRQFLYEPELVVRESA